MRTVTALCILLVGMIAAASSAADLPPLQVKFELTPDTTLPEIPVSFRFTFTNPTDQDIAVPNRLMILVHDPDGQTFAAGDPHFAPRLDSWNGKVPPHALVVREILTEGSMRQPAWLGDARFARTGVFQLQALLVFGRIRDDAEIADIRQQSIASNTTVLTVQEPQGIDAQVLRQLFTICGRRCPAGWLLGTSQGQAAFVKHVVSDYPRSSYAGWFATMLPTYDTEERIALLRGWLADAPEDQYTDWRRLFLANDEMAEMHRYGRVDPANARIQEQKAREILIPLVQKTKIDAVRQRAQEKLDYLNTPEPSD